MNSIIFIGAIIGLLTGGWQGLLLGAGLGWAAGAVLRLLVIKVGLGAIQQQFLDSTFAVMGAVSKADGQVTHDEIRVAEALFDRLRLAGDKRDAAKAAFARGKAAGFDLDAEVARFRRASRGQRALVQMFLQVQISAMAADGELHPAEHRMLLRVGRGLGLSEAEVQRLEDMLRSGVGGSAATTQQSLADAYQVLGLGAGASDADLKKAYRRLMSQNHPDKLAGKGLPESMRTVAEERTRAITSAYQLINHARA